MLMTILFMITLDGILGEGSSREMLLINHGFGPQGITKLITPPKLYGFNLHFDSWMLHFLQKGCSCCLCLDTVLSRCLLYSNNIQIHCLFPMSLQGESIPFKPYSHRFHVPYEASDSTSPFWYSIKRASAHIIVMASYSAFGRGSLNHHLLNLMAMLIMGVHSLYCSIAGKIKIYCYWLWAIFFFSIQRQVYSTIQMAWKWATQSE